MPDWSYLGTWPKPPGQGSCCSDPSGPDRHLEQVVTLVFGLAIGFQPIGTWFVGLEIGIDSIEKNQINSQVEQHWNGPKYLLPWRLLVFKEKVH